MTADPRDLTTVATLKSYVSPGTSDLDLMQRLITAASVAIQNYINFDIISQSYTDYYDGTGGRVMVLSQNPITAVASVTIGSQIVPAGSSTVCGFYFDNTRLILNGYSFCRGIANVAVTYTAGYATVPPDIEQFCIGTVQYWLNDRQRGGEVSRSMGGQTITYSQKDMPDWVKTGLNNLKKVVSV